MASAGGAGTRHRFVGQLGHTSEDETGLLYMRARYYDPAIGRFTSRDRYPALNAYFYCRNDPTNRVDPTGHFSLPEEATAVAEGLGLDGSSGGGLAAFSQWYKSKIAQCVGRQSIKLVVEFVEEGAVEASGGVGNAQFIATLERLTIQLEPGAANPSAFVHELAEAYMWYQGGGTGALSGIVSETQGWLWQVFAGFL